MDNVRFNIAERLQIDYDNQKYQKFRGIQIMLNDPAINQALQLLIEGNKRFAAMNATHPNQSKERRDEVKGGQKPFAVIVGCSDSRIPPEILFDQGIGDVFVIRLAGNIVDDTALGSIEYAVEHLGTRLIMVLGHDKCGAVTAAVKGGDIPGHIGSIVKAIAPAVKKAKNQSGDLLENAIRENVAMAVDRLKSSSSLLAHLVKDGVLKIVGAYYRLDDGKVTLVP